MAERKFEPLSDKSVLGAPCRGIISSVIKRAMVNASMLYWKNFWPFRKIFHKDIIQQFPFQVTGTGPKISKAILSKAAETGIGNSGARRLFHSFFRIEQSWHDRTRCSTSLYIPRQ